MNITIIPTRLFGTITPPPSKSQAHRLLIAAALAEGDSVISNVGLSQDIAATLSCMEALGAKICWQDENTVVLTGIGGRRQTALPRLDCGESGSTLRFLIPVALAVAGGGEFHGRGRLMQRPQEPYFEIFREKGIAFSRTDDTLMIKGTLTPGTYRLRGDVSSQFITGLLYALPLLEGDSEIQITTKLESRDYVAMTLDALERFGVRVEQDRWRSFRIPGGQTYRAKTLAVEADWSQAGFWYAAAGIGNSVTVTGMDPSSLQGDKAILSWGRAIAGEGEGHTASIDVSHCPDLVPPAAAWGALMNGTLYLKNAARLRIKESDRLRSTATVLSALGAKVTELEDSLVIEGQASLKGGVTVDAWNDHRIAMMAAVAATRCREPVTITGAQCVNKSYPAFWQDYAGLGGLLEETE